MKVNAKGFAKNLHQPLHVKPCQIANRPNSQQLHFCSCFPPNTYQTVNRQRRQEKRNFTRLNHRKPIRLLAVTSNFSNKLVRSHTHRKSKTMLILYVAFYFLRQNRCRLKTSLNLLRHVQISFIYANLLERISEASERMHYFVGNLLIKRVIHRQKNRFSALQPLFRQKQRNPRLNPIFSGYVISSANGSTVFRTTRIHANDNRLIFECRVSQFFTLRKKIIQIHQHYYARLHRLMLLLTCLAVTMNRHMALCSTDLSFPCKHQISPHFPWLNCEQHS